MQVGLNHHGEQRLVHPPPLKHHREGRAAAELQDRQLQITRRGRAGRPTILRSGCRSGPQTKETSRQNGLVSETIGVLGAVAALLAAVLSAATFFITNRRDDRKCLRDALLEAMVEFANGSFQRYSRVAFETMSQGGDLQKHHERSSAGRWQQNRAVTRLRLLAPPAVVRSAEAVAKEDRLRDAYGKHSSDPSKEAVCRHRGGTNAGSVGGGSVRSQAGRGH